MKNIKIKKIIKLSLLIFLSWSFFFGNVLAKVDKYNSLSEETGTSITLTNSGVIEEWTKAHEEDEWGNYSIVAKFSSSDNWDLDTNFADGNEFEISKASDSDDWKIKFKEKPDYELKTEYLFRLLKKDSDSKYVAKKEIKIEIKNINGAPTNLTLDPQKIVLLYSTDRLIGIFDVKDDGENGRISIELVNGDDKFKNPNYIKSSCRDDDKDGIYYKYDSDDDGNGLLDYGKKDYDDDGIVDFADADANGNGKIDDENDDEIEDREKFPLKKDANKDGWDDDVYPLTKECTQESPHDYTGRTAQQSQFDGKKEPDYFYYKDFFKIVGRRLYLKDNWDYKSLTVKDVTFRATDGENKTEATFDIEINNKKTAKATYQSEGNGGKILLSILGLAMAGYFMCYQGAAAYSAPGEAVDALSVPTNPRGSKLNTGVKAAKACGLDVAANAIKKTILQGMIKSLTKWVKGGFKGSPSFLSDPKQFLNDATGGILGQFINGDSDKVICSSFRVPLKFAINEMIKANIALGGHSSNGDGQETDEEMFDENGYNLPSEDLPKCTIPMDLEERMMEPDYFGDIQNFMMPDGTVNNELYWNQQLLMYLPQNQLASVIIDTKAALEDRISAIQEENEADAERGSGYLSVRKCERKGTNGYPVDQAWQECSRRFEVCKNEGGSLEECNAKKNACTKANASGGQVECHYTTPGDTVANEVNETVGIERKSVELADSFNELIFALIGQLIKGIFGSDDGLSGSVSYDLSDMPDPVMGNLTGATDYIKKVYNKNGYDLAYDLREARLKILEEYKKKLNIIATKLEADISGKMFVDDGSGAFYRDDDRVTDSYVCHEAKADVLQDLKKDITEKLADVDELIQEATENLDDTTIWDEPNTDEDVKAYVEIIEKSGVSNEEFGSASLKLQKKGQPEVTQAYQEYQSAIGVDSEYYGNQGYNGDKSYYAGGYYSMLKYIEEFKNSCNLADGHHTAIDMYSWSNIQDLELKANEVDSADEIVSQKEAARFQRKITRYGRDMLNTGYTGDPTDTGGSGYEIRTNGRNQYYSIVAPESPAASPSKDGSVNNWVDFFTKIPSIRIGGDGGKEFGFEQKQLKGSKFLTFVSSIQYQNCVDTAAGGDVKKCSKYDLYRFPVEHFAYYNSDPSNEVNNIKGQGKYRTLETNGRSWESFKVYIPPNAVKVGLMMKASNPNYKDYLYRMHMTYDATIIDHRNVKTLDYQKDASDADHTGLKEFFEDQKTVLLNITDYYGNLDDLNHWAGDADSEKTNPENGINTAGIVFGQDVLEEYAKKGGWLYFDIIEDTYLRNKNRTKTKLDFIYYVGMEGGDWSPAQIEINTKEKNVTVIGIDEGDTKPVLTLKGNSDIEIQKGDIFDDAGFVAYDKDNNDISSFVRVKYPDGIRNGHEANKVGTYHIIYEISDLNENTIKEKKIRTVKVVE